MNLIDYDNWLSPYTLQIESRHANYNNQLSEIEGKWESLDKFASAHNYFGLHKNKDGWTFREWAPNAKAIYIVGDFTHWEPASTHQLTKKEDGIWEINLPNDALKHGDFYKLWMEWEQGSGMRIPAYARSVFQDDKTKLFSARVWDSEPFIWTDTDFKPTQEAPLIYEAHIGMALEEERVGTYLEFTEQILPKIKKAGYNTIQLMAIQEHPYYASFGYHVSNFFAPTSRFGTPDELKHLVNTAHEMGITVIMDIVHSHAVKNEEEGLSRFDGTYHQYFHAGERGDHPAWDSRCFNYGKEEVVKFLLSNCKYWLEEFHFDGFRFDGVTSMLYLHHGLDKNFVSYEDYFTGQEDVDAITYLTLANQLIHEIKPNALSVAEEMSGYPGLTIKPEEWGLGFDYRLSMGVPDLWIKLIKEKSDENWNVAELYYELIQHRPEEKIIAYAESHDQALVGDKTIIFRLIDKEMYWFMSKFSPSMIVDRGVALHKMIRLVTASTINGGYLTFMGNEFGHPEWIDFPREGNDWSYKYARRQWSLEEDSTLKYHYMSDFDKEMIALINSVNDFPDTPIIKIWEKKSDNVLAYMRKDLLFIYNFNPTNSYTDYGMLVPEGEYKVVLNTDEKRFGGFGLTNDSIHHFSNFDELYKKEHKGWLRIYIPAHTAVVLKKISN